MKALGVTVERLPLSTGDYDTAMQLWMVLGAFAPPLLLVIFGIIIWMCAYALANMILRNNNSERTDIIAPSYNVHVIAFSSIGLYILCSLIFNTVNDIGFSYFWLLVDGKAQISRGLILVDVLYFITKLVIGLWLLLGSRRSIDLIKKLRRD
jgi:hypothetical protein